MGQRKALQHVPHILSLERLGDSLPTHRDVVEEVVKSDSGTHASSATGETGHWVGASMVEKFGVGFLGEKVSRGDLHCTRKFDHTGQSLTTVAQKTEATLKVLEGAALAGGISLTNQVHVFLGYTLAIVYDLDQQCENRKEKNHFKRIKTVSLKQKGY